MDPSSASRDPALMVQAPRTRHRSVPSGPPSVAVTDGRVRREREQRSIEVVLLSTLKSVLTPPSCGEPTTGSSASSLVDDVVTNLRRSILLPLNLRMIKQRPFGEQVVLAQRSKALVFQSGGCRRGATDRAFLCGLNTCTDGLSVVFFPALCVQGMRRGVCKPQKSCTTTIVRGRLTLLRHQPGLEFQSLPCSTVVTMAGLRPHYQKLMRYGDWMRAVLFLSHDAVG